MSPETVASKVKKFVTSIFDKAGLEIKVKYENGIIKTDNSGEPKKLVRFKEVTGKVWKHAFGTSIDFEAKDTLVPANQAGNIQGSLQEKFLRESDSLRKNK